MPPRALSRREQRSPAVSSADPEELAHAREMAEEQRWRFRQPIRTRRQNTQRESPEAPQVVSPDAPCFSAGSSAPSSDIHNASRQR